MNASYLMEVNAGDANRKRARKLMPDGCKKVRLIPEESRQAAWDFGFNEEGLPMLTGGVQFGDVASKSVAICKPSSPDEDKIFWLWEIYIDEGDYKARSDEFSTPPFVVLGGDPRDFPHIALVIESLTVNSVLKDLAMKNLMPHMQTDKDAKAKRRL